MNYEIDAIIFRNKDYDNTPPLGNYVSHAFEVLTGGGRVDTAFWLVFAEHSIYIHPPCPPYKNIVDKRVIQVSVISASITNDGKRCEISGDVADYEFYFGEEQQ